VSDAAPFVPARDHATRSWALPCACGAWTEAQQDARDAPLPAGARCRGCGAALALDLAGHVDAAGHLDGCPACAYHTLCIQKDFNPRLGVALVVVSFAALFLLAPSMPWLLTGLVLLAAVDWLLLRLAVKRLLICYRCKAQFRGFPPGPRCRPFDLATWEAHTPPADEARG
jgi:hypothetical protein